MRAMVLNAPNELLALTDVHMPAPRASGILLRVEACAVCRTDLHIFHGELTAPYLPLILGHQIVGTVVKKGKRATRFQVSDRVGVSWLGQTCGGCRFCQQGRENLCTSAQFTGYHLNGGFAEFCCADERYCFPLPSAFSPISLAPLLCGGLIGWRAFRLASSFKKFGFYGFGSAAHILIQLATLEKKKVYAFTRPGDLAAQRLAEKLGAVWAGSSEESPPTPLEAALIFAPIGALVPQALQAVAPGGSVICLGIHMSDIPAFPYSLLYQERSLTSVANLTRQDGETFFARIKGETITTKTTIYPLEQANEALRDLDGGKITGSAVISVASSSEKGC